MKGEKGLRPLGERSATHRITALDGVRAFAVAAVLLYHAGVPGVSGGLLGVDVFFVLSGFLITRLLCNEFEGTQKIRLGRFWSRRARRLLPPVIVLMLGIAAYAWIFRNTLDLSSIRGDSIATLLYVANWHFILSSQGYFSQALAPSPLLHMWSLGVEEQYYLVWPLIALFLLRRFGIRGVRTAAVIGAGLSALEMGLMYVSGVSIDRMYYGTDTRAQALLVGSALGTLALNSDSKSEAKRSAGPTSRRGIGIAVAAVSTGVLVWSFHALNGQDSILYEGGFLIVALTTAAIIGFVVTSPASGLARLLSVAPIAYIGRISYGLYVYHWPIFLAIDHAHTGLSGSVLLATRLALTIAVATLSFHLVEMPVRRWRMRPSRGIALGVAGGLFAATLVVVATIPPSFADSVSITTTLPKTSPEYNALERSGAFRTNPIQFLLVGDSEAVTTSEGLGVSSVPRFGVRVTDAGVVGCRLTNNSIRIDGTVLEPVPTNLDCGSWPTDWAEGIRRLKPDVVGLLIGRFELADTLSNGKWVHVGEPGWDSVLLQRLRLAVQTLSETGAKIVVFTFPYINPPQEQPNGDLWPENDPARVASWNDLLEQVASEYPTTVTLIDLNQILDPQDRYSSIVDGVEVRDPDDGIHVTLQGGEWLQPKLLPKVAELGLASTARKQRS